jgi:hypothetical protein
MLLLIFNQFFHPEYPENQREDDIPDKLLLVTIPIHGHGRGLAA